MNEDLYWSLLQQAQDNTADLDEMEEYLVNALENLTPKEMVGFYLRAHITFFIRRSLLSYGAQPP